MGENAVSQRATKEAQSATKCLQMFACWQGFVILTQILQFLLKYQFSTLTPWGWEKVLKIIIKNG
jgi:hypothetical protein